MTVTGGGEVGGIALLAASLAPGVEHVAAVVEVAQVRLGGTHRFEILEHVPQVHTDSLKIVTRRCMAPAAGALGKISFNKTLSLRFRCMRACMHACVRAYLPVCGRIWCASGI